MSFFKKRNDVAVSDIVYMNEQQRNKGLATFLSANGDGIVICWFQQDLDRLRSQLPQFAEDRFVLAGRLISRGHSRAVFAGHYPLHAPELALCDSMGMGAMTVYTHLDAPLLQFFGAEHIKDLVRKMGMDEEESLSHALISRAIQNAQEKIARACIADMSATSEAEWMKMNMPA